MKSKRTLFYLLMIISLSSCEKINFVKDISGNWELSSAYGGDPTISISMNFTRLVLNKKNEYFIYSSDTLKAIGKYSLNDSGYDSKSYFEGYFIKFKSGGNPNTSVTFPLNQDLDIHIQHSDTLVLYQRGYADGLGLAFIKK